MGSQKLIIIGFQIIPSQLSTIGKANISVSYHIELPHKMAGKFIKLPHLEHVM